MEKNNKEEFKIFGFSIWRIFTYFIIYSIVGYILETAFAIATKGVIESRKSFLYGPFCAIYGVGAAIMIIFLQFFDKNNNSLFFGGFIIGSIVEYIVSWVGELILHVKWWDYSSIPLNLNGRICVFFSLFWGFLAIYLITYFNPKVDKLINWTKEKFPRGLLKFAISVAIVLLFIDCCITGFAEKLFFSRLVTNNNLELSKNYDYILDYNQMQQDLKFREFVEKYWNDEKMLKTFPNLKLTAKDGSIIYVSDLLKDIIPYYVRIFTPKTGEKINIIENN